MTMSVKMTVALRRLELEHKQKLNQQPNYRTELGTNFRFLCFVILTQQTTDKKAFEVAKQLFKTYPNPKDIINAKYSSLVEIIKPLGLQRIKSSALKEISIIIQDDYDGTVPHTFDELIKLPKVGRKTANVILGECFGIPTFPVDTHIMRITSRLVGHRLTESKCEKLLKSLIDESQWFESHRLLIEHGREVCTSAYTKCSTCPLANICSYYDKYKVPERNRTNV